MHSSPALTLHTHTDLSPSAFAEATGSKPAFAEATAGDVAPEGIEPPPREPESLVLSIKLRSQ